MTERDEHPHDLMMEYRRMAAGYAVGTDLKHVHLNVTEAHKAVDRGDEPTVTYPVRDRIENMRREDLEDAYALLLEMAVCYPETLTDFALPAEVRERFE